MEVKARLTLQLGGASCSAWPNEETGFFPDIPSVLIATLEHHHFLPKPFFAILDKPLVIRVFRAGVVVGDDARTLLDGQFGGNC